MPDTTAPAPVCKVRLRFAKTDDLRFLSHHDLMRLLERLLRRAGLPFRSTEGFHPKPKITFASALSLGIVGRQEVVEIEFDGDLDPQHVLKALQALAPEGLTFFQGMLVPVKKTAQPIRAVYHFPLPPQSRPDLSTTIDGLLAQKSLVISRTRNVPLRPAQEEPLGEERLDALTNAEPVQTKIELKKFDIRPFLRRLWRDEHGVWMDVFITNQGAARAEELLRLVELEDSWLDGDAVLERTVLEIEDEADTRSQALPGNALSTKLGLVSDRRTESDTQGRALQAVGSQAEPGNQVTSLVKGKSVQALASLMERRSADSSPPRPLPPTEREELFTTPVATGSSEQE